MDRPNEVNRLLQKSHHLRAYINHIEKENRVLAGEISELKKRIEELEQAVKDTSKAVRSLLYKERKQTDSPKKLGPPEGHTGHVREMPRVIHRREELSLKECPDCQGPLSGPVRMRTRIVEDIRPPEPMNTEYRIPYYWCPCCKRQVTPQPAGVIPKCRFGIRLMLLVTFLRYGLSLPYNKIARELLIVYGIHLSEGCLVDSLTRFADYAGTEFEQIKQEVRKLKAVHTDWTGWRVGGKNTTLWDFVDRGYSLLIIRNDRSRGVVEEVLGEDYQGTVISDCMPATSRLACRQQKCWVHFLRYTRELDSLQGKRLHRRLKRIYRSARSGKADTQSLLRRIDRLQSLGFTEKKCVLMVRRLQKYRDSLFTFVEVPGVSDNNNEAERGLRSSVVMRKITGGNRSDKGARNHEVIMSVMNTWGKQGRDFFEEGMRVVQENLR